jgi:hypothetical protein
MTDMPPIPHPTPRTEGAGSAPAARSARKVPWLLVVAAAVAAAVGLGAAGLAAVSGGPHRGGVASATATSTAQGATASADTAPATEVQPVHDALHDIDDQCKPGAVGGDQSRLARDADVILAFAQRHPSASFPIDDETGRTLSLLLVTRQALRDCAPAVAARADSALPAQFRTNPASPR